MTSRARYSLVVFLLVAAVVCAGLGRWQLDRLRQRRERNAAVRAALALPPVTIAPGAVRPASLVHRRVRATGRYDTAHELVVRGQVFEGAPGVHLVTPLILEGSDSAVLVLRGFAPAADAVTVSAESPAEPGVVTVEGDAAVPDSTAERGEPLERKGRTTYRWVDIGAARAALPYPVMDLLIEQRPGPGVPKTPRRLPRPGLDDGPHLSYAIQWFAFMTMALVFAGIFWLKRDQR